MRSSMMLTAIPRARPQIFRIEKNLSFKKTREKNLMWVRSMGVLGLRKAFRYVYRTRRQRVTKKSGFMLPEFSLHFMLTISSGLLYTPDRHAAPAVKMIRSWARLC